MVASGAREARRSFGSLASHEGTFVWITSSPARAQQRCWIMGTLGDTGLAPLRYAHRSEDALRSNVNSLQCGAPGVSRDPPPSETL